MCKALNKFTGYIKNNNNTCDAAISKHTVQFTAQSVLAAEVTGTLHGGVMYYRTLAPPRRPE